MIGFKKSLALKCVAVVYERDLAKEIHIDKYDKLLDPQRLQAQGNPPFSSCLFLFHGKPKLSRHNHRHKLLPAMKCGH